MRLWIPVLATLALAAPAQAATLPATFGDPATTPGTGDDLVAVNGGFAVTHGQDGTITVGAASYAVAGQPGAIVAADLDQDGHQDLVTAAGSSFSTLLGKADGSFQAATSTSFPGPEQALDVAVGQLTQDTKPDVVIATGQSNVMLFPGGSGPPVYIPVDGATARIALADLNADGRTDIAVSTADRVKLVLNSDLGYAQQPTAYTASGRLALADLNGDGRTDLVAGDGVRLGQPGAAFGDAKPFTGGTGDLQVADLNADGRPDVVVTRADGGLTVLAGKGDGTLAQGTTLAGTQTHGVAITDANGDGRPDLASAGDAFQLRLNTTARSTATAPATSDHRALAINYAANGTALPTVRLYVKRPGTTTFALAGEQPTASGPFAFSTDSDGAYGFYTALVDADGNEEAAPTTADATTAVTLTRAITAGPLAFAGQLLGTASPAVATQILNSGEATLKLAAPQLSSANFALTGGACTGATLKPGDSCVLQFAFTPTAAGPLSAHVTLAPGGLDLSGEGIAPPVVLSAPTPPPPPAPPVRQKVAGKLVATYKHGKLTKLTLTGLTKGATVKANRGKATFTKRGVSTKPLSLAALVKKRGAKIVVTISKSGLTSVTHTLTVKTKKISSS